MSIWITPSLTCDRIRVNIYLNIYIYVGVGGWSVGGRCVGFIAVSNSISNNLFALLSWYHVMQSNICNSFQDLAPEYEICGSPIFKLDARI